MTAFSCGLCATYVPFQAKLHPELFRQNPSPNITGFGLNEQYETQEDDRLTPYQCARSNLKPLDIATIATVQRSTGLPALR